MLLLVQAIFGASRGGWAQQAETGRTVEPSEAACIILRSVDPDAQDRVRGEKPSVASFVLGSKAKGSLANSSRISPM